MRLISRFSSLIHLLATSALATAAIALLDQSAIGQSITEVRAISFSEVTLDDKIWG